tara:strand:+ start:1488 stop:1712 length:225 start_codon:yes stop_codon:yes gene_type:complete
VQQDTYCFPETPEATSLGSAQPVNLGISRFFLMKRRPFGGTLQVEYLPASKIDYSVHLINGRKKKASSSYRLST